MEKRLSAPEGPRRNIERKPTTPLFEITLMRHAKPYYSDEGHDLTPEGVEQATSAGKMMKDSGYFDGSDVYLVHSPTPRAKGTLEFVAEAAGLEDETARSINQLRRSDIHDMDTFLASFAELAETEGLDPAEAAAKHHYVHPMHEEGVIIEKASKKRERLYRSLENLARWFETHPNESGKTPHVLAVSHFEIITHLLHDVFDITTMDSYNRPAFAEMLRIKAYPGGDKKLRLLVSYNGLEKEAIFDRNKRAIESAS